MSANVSAVATVTLEELQRYEVSTGIPPAADGGIPPLGKGGRETAPADGNSLRLPPADCSAESRENGAKRHSQGGGKRRSDKHYLRAAPDTSLEEGGYGAGEEVSAEELERLSGMWVEDPAPYLTDMRHPVVREEWDERQMRRGRLPWEPESLRERRQFDREMVAKYGKIYPPPKRAKWLLATHDIIDQQEERERRRQTAAARQPVYEEVYIDEEI